MKPLWHKTSVLLFLFLSLQSCGPVRLISDYDEVTDKTSLELQEEIDALLIKLERTAGTAEANYDKYVQTYDVIKVTLKKLKIRTAAIPKNKLVEDQVAELEKMVGNLEKLHKQGFGSAGQVNILQQPFDTAFTSITKLQIALKRGEN